MTEMLGCENPDGTLSIHSALTSCPVCHDPWHLIEERVPPTGIRLLVSDGHEVTAAYFQRDVREGRYRYQAISLISPEDFTYSRPTHWRFWPKAPTG